MQLKSWHFLLFSFICILLSEIIINPSKRSKKSFIYNYLLGICLFTVVILASYLLNPLINWTQENHWGLWSNLALPKSIQLILEVLTLDLSLYFWHRINHKFNFLFKLHSLHHSDLMLDHSSFFRFHPLEIILSYFIRILVILIFGLSPEALALFSVIFLPIVVFQHSSIILPARVEKILSKIIVSPRIHHLHHSAEEKDLNKNFASIFSFWDQIFRTFNNRKGPIKYGITEHQN